MISLKNIAAAATNKKTYERGVEYYDQRRISNLIVKKEPNSPRTHISADVQGSKASYDVEMTLDENGGLVSHYCDCPAFYSYEGCCKHVVAVLLQYYYRRILENEQPVNHSLQRDLQTDSLSQQMIKKYSEKLINGAVALASQKKARLSPALEFDKYGRLSLSLSVGHERMYIVKDIGKFYSDMCYGTVVDYGAKLKLLHDENAFEEKSKPLLRFFMNKYRELSAYFGGMPYSAITDKRSLFLSPRAFDEFFELYEGREVSLNFGVFDRSLIPFVNMDPNITLHVQKSGNAFDLALTPLPQMYVMGERCQYLLLDSGLYRCSADYTKATSTLFSSFIQKKGPLTVGLRDMGTLCSNVLGTVGDYVHVEADENELTIYYPAELTAKLFLDMPAEGLVTGNLIFCYGTVEIPAMKETKTAFQRDIKGELLSQSLVNKYFEAYDPEHEFMFMQDDDRIYLLFSDGIAEMSGCMEIYTTDRIKQISIKKPPAVQIGVKLHGNLIDLTFDTGEFPPEELASLLTSYRQKKRYHKLRDGSFIDLQNTPLSGVSKLADGLGLSEKELASGEATVPKYRAMYIDGMIKASPDINSERDGEFRSMVRDIKDVDDSDIQPPESLSHILRNYQKTGFRWLRTMGRYGFGGILADDMGLGKTLQAIAYLLSCKAENDGKILALIVCPTSLVLNWQSEIQRFSPTLSSIVISGSAQQRRELIEQINDYDTVITSYDLLKRDVELYGEYEFDCQIIDEAQYIKNSVTQNARAVKEIQSAQRFALTGTPVENSLAEIWSIFDFLMPGYLYSHARFKQKYELPIVKGGDEEALANLKNMLSPFILRRLKSNVLKELPPKTESELFAALDGEQSKLYAANLAQIRLQLTSQFERQGYSSSKVMVLAMLTRLRQICCDPSLCYENYAGESAKLNLCLDLLESCVAAGHKVLVFSQFTSMLSILESRLDVMGISYYVLKGSTPKEERASLTSRFNSDKTNVFLISLKAGGTGINLTGADIVIHYDPWWNVSAQNQATDRAHRIGQKNSVQVYKLIAKDTIEEKILKLQRDKMKLADSVITDGEGIISKMSRDEIMALFDD